jgi:diaminopimelate decarboxylase
MRRLELFPLTTVLEQDVGGACVVDRGCRLSALAAEFGTPLYCFDAATLNDAAEQYRVALASADPGPLRSPMLGKRILRWGLCGGCSGRACGWTVRERRAGDCGAGGAGVRATVLVHGVHKSDEDLTAAVRFAAVIAVDNLPELYRLSPLLHAASRPPALWLRVRPGVAVETHTYRQTGQEESKFGMALSEVMEAVRYCLAQATN